MKTIRKLWLFICLIGIWNHYAQAQGNVCLDFDGNDDFAFATIPTQNGNFTVEMWFKSSNSSTNTSCLTNFRRLFSLLGSSTGDRVEVGECGGNLSISYLTGGVAAFPQTATTISPNTWYHIALQKNGPFFRIFLNCDPVWISNSTNPASFDRFFLAHQPTTGSSPAGDFIGQIDEVRVWDVLRNRASLLSAKYCVLRGDEPNLILYWNFDEGIPAGNNTATTSIPDLTSNGSNGDISSANFSLTGTTSNYVNSGASLAYPNLNGCDLEIKDYPYQSNLLTEVCNGDPMHFRLSKNGQVPSPSGNVVGVEWYMEDANGTTLLPNSPFSGYSFGVLAGDLTYDCASSTDGYVDALIFARSTVREPNSGEECEYDSEKYPLRICCPVDDATLTISPTDLACEDTIITLNVSLTSIYPYINNPGPFVDIEWFFNGASIGYLDQTSISHTFTVPTVSSTTSMCFEAVITNCSAKSETFSACITVDPDPVCGGIIPLPQGTPQNLTLLSTSPHQIYEICPGNDAILGENPADTFEDCIPQWQYSFTATPGSWVNLGTSNTVQNTNIIPTSMWPGTQVFYRVQCNPYSNPSACEPCYSDMIEIRLSQPQTLGAPISANTQVCKDDPNSISISGAVPTGQINWFCDGLQVASNSPVYTYIAEKSACYWYEVNDGCFIQESSKVCVEVCEVVAVLSCPLPPNDCACIGDPIDLTACDSFSTCANANLQYTWFIDGVQQSTTACNISHTPAASGTTYRVEVLDLTTGCMSFAEQTIVPCDKN